MSLQKSMTPCWARSVIPSQCNLRTLTIKNVALPFLLPCCLWYDMGPFMWQSNGHLMSCSTSQVESFMTAQVSLTSANHRSHHSYVPHIDYACDYWQSSCSKFPPPRFHGSNKSPRQSPCPLTDTKPAQAHTARDGMHNKSACPGCLGHHPHDINNCIVQYLWDGSLAYTRCTPEGRYVDPTGDILCHDWQKPQGCSHPHFNFSTPCGWKNKKI